jgi:hypothetical protein
MFNPFLIIFYPLSCFPQGGNDSIAPSPWGYSLYESIECISSFVIYALAPKGGSDGTKFRKGFGDPAKREKQSPNTFQKNDYVLTPFSEAGGQKLCDLCGYLFFILFLH